MSPIHVLTTSNLIISCIVLAAALYLAFQWKDWRGLFLYLVSAVQAACVFLFFITLGGVIEYDLAERIVQWAGYCTGNALIMLLSVDRFLHKKGASIRGDHAL